MSVLDLSDNDIEDDGAENLVDGIVGKVRHCLVITFIPIWFVADIYVSSKSRRQ